MNDCDDFDDDDDDVMIMMMMMVMMTMLQNKALDIPLHTSCLSATQPLERELPHGTQLFEAVPPDQPAEDALHRPLVHTSAYKQTSGEAVYLDDMPLLEGQIPSAVTPLLYPTPSPFLVVLKLLLLTACVQIILMRLTLFISSVFSSVMCTPSNTACGINFACALLRNHLLLMLRYVHRDYKDYYERGAQDGHLDFHTVLRLHVLKL